LGIAGVGAYVLYEYTRYQGATQRLPPQAQNVLPFTTWLWANLTGTSGLTPTQLQAFNYINQAVAGTLPSAPATPGTTQATQPTSVSTVPTTTVTTTAPSTPAVTQPTAADLQKALNLTVATADQWNYVYAQLMGYGIDRVYGFSFDQVYGPVVNGVRNKGALITANAFLNAPGLFGFTRQGKLSGLGLLQRFYGPTVTTIGNMIYQAHHPSPYGMGVRRLGMGALEQATGFEKALWAGQRLRSNQYR
jgi:hypothetical protein